MSHPLPTLRRCFRIVAFALAFVAEPVYAQADGSAAYVEAERFTRADGLPSDYIQALYRDQYGFLWIGTDVGVARYDGAQFEAYGTGEGLPHSFVNRIQEDGDGTLWVATYEGLARLRRDGVERGRFEAVPTPFADPGDASANYALGRDDTGRLVVAVGQHVGVLVGFDDPNDAQTAQWIAVDTGAPFAFVPRLVTLPGGRILSRGDASTLSLVEPHPDAPSALAAQRLATPTHWGPDPVVLPIHQSFGAPLSAEFYVTSLGLPPEVRSGYLYRCRLTEARTPSLMVLDSVRVGSIERLWSRDDGTLLLGRYTPEGFNTRTTTVYRRAAGRYELAWSSAEHSTALLIDDEGSIWMGTFGQGLRRLHPSALTALVDEPTERVAARTDGAGIVAADASIYATTQRTIARVDPARLDVSEAFPFGTNRQRGITIDPRGRISLTWAVNFSIPARPGIINGTKFAAYGHRHTNWYADVDVRGDTLTAATYGGGVMRFLMPRDLPSPNDVVRLDTLTIERGLPTAMTERLVRLPSGLYVLTRSHGAWRLPPVGIQRTQPLVSEAHWDALPSLAAYSLYEDTSGAIWLGTDRGVVRVDGGDGSIEVFEADVIRGQRVTGVFERSATPGLIWLTGDRDLYHLDPATGTIQRSGTLPLVLDAEATINDARYHPATDRLFLATTHHLLAADLVRLANVVPPAPRLAFTAVHVDDAEAAPQGSPLDASLEVAAPGPHRVDVRFAALSLAQAVEAEYRLNGGPWRPVGTERRVVFPDLQPGAHTLAVRAVAPGPVVGEAATLRLTLPPHWWQRGVVRALFVLALVTLVAAVTRVVATRPYRERVRALKLEQKLRSERERISRDLHDHVGAQVTHMIAEIEEARLAHASPASTLDRLDADARAALAQLRETVWTLKQEALTPHALGTRIERFAARQCTSSGLDCAVHIEGADADLAAPLPPMHSLHLYRIAQEAITNAIKYSGGTHVVATLRRTPGRITLTIADDGTFRTSAEPSGDGSPAGFGLAHLRERAEVIGGTSALDTHGGTTVRVAVPLPVEAIPPPQRAF